MLSVRIRVLWAVGFVILMLGSSPAPAWEFLATGSFSWSTDYRSAMGSDSFFGQFDVDRSSGAGGIPVGAYASANGWQGYYSAANPQVFNPGEMTTGADGSRAVFNANFNPIVIMNKAVRMKGTLRAGAGEYLGQIPGIHNAFANFEWTVLWLSVDTPWGTVLLGKKPFGMGCGLQLDRNNRTDESVMLLTYYGPLQFGLGFYPWRRGSGAYGNLVDRNAMTSTDLIGFINYNSANTRMGIGATWVAFDEGPESDYDPASKVSFVPADVNGSEGWIFFKYNNGRLFFNAEADWMYIDTRFHRSQDGTFFGQADNTDGSGSLFSPTFRESWRYMAEIGMVAGPAKLSLLYSFLPGPDRRHGVLIDKQPYIHGPAVANTGVFNPYSFIMSAGYSAGTGGENPTFNDGRDTLNYNGEGYMSDASVLAARLDMAVAANLNTFLSILYAERVSHGYGWGYIEPRILNLTPGTARARFERKGSFADPAPAIPDNSLGVEIGAGVSWKLLENWNLDFRIGIWKPGRWFSYACIDRSVPSWDAPSAANRWGTNPTRSIDPIIAFQTSVSSQF